MFRNLCCLLLALSAAAALPGGEVVTIPANADNSIVMVDGEWHLNAGGSGRMRIKGNQHLVAMSFDVSPLRGKKVIAAELRCFAAAEQISGVSVSTIAAAWDEMKSTALTSGMTEITGWGRAGARFPEVCGGNSFTLVCQSVSDAQNGVYHWQVAPDLIHALCSGVAYGLAIHEHDADYARNPTVFSREQSGRGPVLVVEVEDSTFPQPQPPEHVSVEPVDSESAVLHFRAPADGFALEITVNGTELPRQNVPLLEPGSMQKITLRDLPHDVTSADVHLVALRAVGRDGQRSAVVSTTSRLFSTSVLPRSAAQRSPVKPCSVSDISVIPITDRYDARGDAVGQLPEGYRQNNSIYDGNRVLLHALRGEIVGLQLLIRGQGRQKLQMEFANLQLRTDMYAGVPVQSGERRIPDPLLPTDGSLELSAEQDTSLFVDLYVPYTTAPGMHAGQIRVSDGRSVPLHLQVHDLQLPRRASFLCEMNSYGLPDHVDDFYALQKLAYDHRTHLNILHYSHETAAPGARRSNLDMRLRSGRRMDNRRYDSVTPGDQNGWWDDFTAAFGPYLSGELFRDAHRGPIPAPGFYLTFHESWPLNCRLFFNGNPDAFEAFSDSPEYAETWVNVMQDFIRHAEQQGWTETGFQVYLNNKGGLHDARKAPWILDEPAGFWDYRALRFYGELTDRGRSEGAAVQLDYRIDISRPEFARGQLDDRADLWVVSSAAFRNYRRLVQDRAQQDGMRYFVYGTAPPVDQSARQIVAWVLDSFQHGAHGVVPWQTVDKSGRSLKQADQLGLFIFDQGDADRPEIRHSCRLKAFREGQQLVEYLLLLKRQQRWNDEQLRMFIRQYVELNAVVEQRYAEDAGTITFASQRLIAIDQLKTAIFQMLSGG